MKRILKIVSIALLLLVFTVGCIIYLFDYHKPPVSHSSDWHAYLTDDEKEHPLAKYWYKTPKPDSLVLEAIRNGPMPRSEMLAWEDRLELSNPGYQKTENGWCRLEDGSGYVAVKTFFPGATAEMLDWWFVWAQEEEDIRYKIWYPGAHYSMAQIETPDAPKELAFHCATEYSQLASFLPELYELYGPR